VEDIKRVANAVFEILRERNARYISK
jgi:hypothetical protein